MEQPSQDLGALLGLRQIPPKVFTSCHHPSVPGRATKVSSHLMAAQLHTNQPPHHVTRPVSMSHPSRNHG